MARPSDRIDIAHSGEKVREAIEKFRVHFEACIAFNATTHRRIETLRVIHGYGSTGGRGDIKAAFLAHIKEHHIEVSNSVLQVNAGETVVVISKPIASDGAAGPRIDLSNLAPAKPPPSEIEKLSKEISAFPNWEKAESRILQITKLPKSSGEIYDKLKSQPTKLVQLLLQRMVKDGHLIKRDDKFINADVMPK